MSEEESVTTIKDSDVHWVMEWGPQFPHKPPTELMFEKDKAMARLIAEDLVFLGSAYYEKEWPEDARRSTILCVNCNDIFAWGCADAEPVFLDEIRSLYDHWIADRCWGTAKWCAIKRNQKPQPPVIEMMKKQGSWDGQMEVLGENTQDAEVQALFDSIGGRAT